LRHLVNISAGADLQQTLADLALLGAVTPTGTTERRVEVEAPAAWEELIEGVEGVASCCDLNQATIRQDLLNVSLNLLAAGQWGPAYISHRDDLTAYDRDATGLGVRIYSVDTLADPATPDLGGRAQVIHNPDGLPLDAATQHGTLTLGWAGGTAYGVAPDAGLFNSAAWNGNGVGSLTSILAAFDAVADHIEANPPALTPVVNASLSITGQGLGDPTIAVIDRLRALGAIVVVSSGNDSITLGAIFTVNVWPAMNPNVVTVGAHDKLSVRADFSNQGGVVDLHAPGVQCSAANQIGQVVTADGTSISAPFVAGALACAIQAGEADPVAWLLSQAIPGILTNVTSGAAIVAHKPATILSGPVPGATWRPNRRRTVNGGTFAQRPSGRLKADAGRHSFTYSATNRLDGGHVNG